MMKGKLTRGVSRTWAMWFPSRINCLVLTQVPGHQVGIVEILHSQSNDVDKILDDLHELHRPGIDLDKWEKENG